MSSRYQSRVGAVKTSPPLLSRARLRPLLRRLRFRSAAGLPAVVALLLGTVSASPAFALPLPASMLSWLAAAIPRSAPEAPAIEIADGGGGVVTALYYRPAGVLAEAVVLLHGPGGSPERWSTVAATLRDAGIAVLVPDLRDSETPPSEGYYEVGIGRFRGSGADVRRSAAFRKTLAAVRYLDRELEVSGGRRVLATEGAAAYLAVATVDRSSAEVVPIALVDPVLLGDQQLLVRSLEHHAGPVLVVARGEDVAACDIGRRLYGSRPRERSYWRLDALPGRNRLVSEPQFCQDLVEWTLEAMRKSAATARDASS